MCELGFGCAAAVHSKTGLKIQIGTHFGITKHPPTHSGSEAWTHCFQFQNPGYRTHKRSALWVFLESLGHIGWRMRTSSGETLVSRSFSVRLLGAIICLLAGALPLVADTPSMLRGIPTGGCYCHCAESKVRGGCVKMCESKKYAYRWWATSCAKPHMSTPRGDSHAGPRYPHPRRTEHAKL